MTNDLARKVMVKDVSGTNVHRDPDQFCTIAEFIAYNFDGSTEGDEQEAERFKTTVLSGKTFRLDVSMGCSYEIVLAD